jgi:DNA-binding MarR family transcriptional regulator/N-acetylglutamate synthase-like GNAT family acetyltransferase
MDGAAVSTVRRFNRTVTQRIGVLDDEYLARGRPLAASRVLWEVGLDGSDVRALRARLGLDSGYLSRLLRSLEDEGLVTVTPDGVDARVRKVAVTGAGRLEYLTLEGLSDDLAWSLLTPLDEEGRRRLLEAMAVVDRLLQLGQVVIAPEDPYTADADACLRAYVAEIDGRFESGFELDAAEPFSVDDMVEPEGMFLVARIGDRPVGCGALHFFVGGVADMKRMWVDPSVRGVGLGRRLLVELEAQARAHGVHLLRLETNRALSEAIALYRAVGFEEVDAFNDEVHAHHWFAKPLDSSGRGS